MSKKARVADSDQDEAVLDTLGKDLDAQHAGILNNAHHSLEKYLCVFFPSLLESLSPFGNQGKEDLDFFPLAKSEKESKKARRYRGAVEPEEIASAPERERSRKHKSEKERKRQLVSPPSAHKSHGSGARRTGRASGRSSPQAFEGRRSLEHQGPSRERERERERPRERESPPPHGYQPDRDDGYRRSGGSRERSRHAKDHREGRRGNGGPPPNLRVPIPRSYQDDVRRQISRSPRSRSPLRERGEPRRRGREEEYASRGWSGHAHHHHSNEPVRRSPYEEAHHRHLSSSSGESSEEDTGGHRPLPLPHQRPAADSGDSSSEGSISEPGSEVSG